MNIWNVIGKVLNLFIEEEEYEAVVETERGVSFVITVKASSESEAERKISDEIVEGCRIIEIVRKG